MKVIVYTAQFGKTDPLFAPCVRNPDVTYVCYSDGWNRNHRPSEDPLRSARESKICHCSNGDVSIWIDASMKLLVDPLEIVNAAEKTGCPISAFKHPARTNITEEAAQCARLGHADRAVLNDQVRTYLADGFTDQSALTSTGLLVRLRSHEMLWFESFWWKEMTTWTMRDQMSIDYSAWKCGMKIGYLPGDYKSNQFVRYYPECTWK